MKINSVLAAALAGVTLAATVPPTAYAQELAIEPEVMETINVTTFLNGGFGKDEQETMHRIAKEFPLRLTLSERKDGEFIADVPVVIADARGNPVFEMHNAGPMLFVMLPKGKYKVSARFNGLIESQNVQLDGKHGKDLYFHWKGKPKA
jgi:hypothetical protein